MRSTRPRDDNPDLRDFYLELLERQALDSTGHLDLEEYRRRGYAMGIREIDLTGFGDQVE